MLGDVLLEERDGTEDTDRRLVLRLSRGSPSSRTTDPLKERVPDHTHKKLVDVAGAREVVVHVFVLSVCVVFFCSWFA